MYASTSWLDVIDLYANVALHKTAASTDPKQNLKMVEEENRKL